MAAGDRGDIRGAIAEHLPWLERQLARRPWRASGSTVCG